VKGRKEVDIESLKRKYPITKPVLLAKSAIIVGFVILMFFLHPVHHKSAAWIAVIGAVGMMLVASPHELHHVMEMVEWDTLLFFAGLFVMIAAYEELGLIRAIGSAVSGLIESVPKERQMAVALTMLVWVSALASSFLDNIPYTATLVPVLVHLSTRTGLPLQPLAWALSLGACLGGNGTLVGSSANLVTSGIAGHAGFPISFKSFSRISFPVVVLTCAVANVYLVVRYAL
jgi:Na+/H+ antiporter NhaD/arsenite permease-like protein